MKGIKPLSKWDEPSENFTSFETITVDGWQLKISTLGQQVMVFAMHPVFDETELQFFKDFNDAHEWIQRITTEWYDNFNDGY